MTADIRVLTKLFVFVNMLLPLAGCAAYHVGNQSLYPSEIHTVYVPMFQSVSFRRHMGERLTEAVMKEIENRTPYKVVADPQADSVLSGRIVEEGKQVLVNSLKNDPSELQARVRVEVSWIDRKGRMLRDGAPVALPCDIIDVEGAGNFVPEAGQSVASAQQQAIQRVAEQIVSIMEKPW